MPVEPFGLNGFAYQINHQLEAVLIDTTRIPYWVIATRQAASCHSFRWAKQYKRKSQPYRSGRISVSKTGCSGSTDSLETASIWGRANSSSARMRETAKLGLDWQKKPQKQGFSTLLTRGGPARSIRRELGELAPPN